MFHISLLSALQDISELEKLEVLPSIIELSVIGNPVSIVVDQCLTQTTLLDKKTTVHRFTSCIPDQIYSICVVVFELNVTGSTEFSRKSFQAPLPYVLHTSDNAHPELRCGSK